MTQQAPGKWFREGISLIELTERFPDEASAAKWLEEVRWPNGRHCAKCGCTDTRDVPNAKPMPYWCRDCKSYFSVRTGTTLQDSRLPLRKWVFAIYLYVTHLNRHSPDDIQIRGNRTTAPSPRELCSHCSHPMT